MSKINFGKTVAISNEYIQRDLLKVNPSFSVWGDDDEDFPDDKFCPARERSFWLEGTCPSPRDPPAEDHGFPRHAGPAIDPAKAEPGYHRKPRRRPKPSQEKPRPGPQSRSSGKN